MNTPNALKINDLLFVNAYLSNGRNATQAYRSVHTKASWDTANVEGCKRLAKPGVQAEIQRRLRSERGITREMIVSDLMTARDMALEQHDATVLSKVSMDMAKLAGLLTDKHEVKDTTDAEKDETRKLILDTLRTQPLVVQPSN